MIEPDAYRVAAGEGAAELRVRGSRFLALASPIADAADVEVRIAARRRAFHDATHVAFAYRRRAGRARVSDAGEPAGTAGKPILAAIDAAGVVDTLVVVVRYFGGIKLGTGGLVRSYGDAARQALAAAGAAMRYDTVRLEVECPYDRVSALKRLLAPPDVVLLREDFGASARFELAVRRSRLPAIEARLAEARLVARR